MICKNQKKSQFIFNDVLGVGGNIEHNPKDLICPNCKGKYVARTYSGELYYRLIMRNQSSKRSWKKKIAKMGLYSNPWACGEYFSKDYLCLNCGIRWNGKDEDIYRDV